MSDVQYPFIDVAVHDRVSEAFAAGMAVVLFSADLRSVSWANGRGAALFGFGSIYDFLDQGLDRGELMFRQVEPIARSLHSIGDRRTFTIRIASGFLRVAVQARCEMIRVQNKPCILLSVPVDNQNLSLRDCAARLIEGFDDPETHMAVLDAEGNILAASGQFSALSISIQTTRMLVSMVGNDRHRLIKRPIATSGGYLPAAIGQVSEEPALNLLFVVGAAKTQSAIIPAVQGDEDADTPDAGVDRTDIVDVPDYDDALSAVAAIEDNPDLEEEISLEDAAEMDAADLIAADENASEATSSLEIENEAAETDVLAATDIDAPSDSQADDEIAGDDAVVEETAEPFFEDAEATESELAEVSVEEPSEENATLWDVAEENDTETDMQEISADQDRYFVDERNGETVEDDVAVEDGDNQVSSAEIVTPVETGEPAAVVALQQDDTDLAPDLMPETVAAPVRRSGTVRFVWKIDENGRFSEVSKEFAEAVGPHAADISGMAFADLAALFNLDPEGKIAELLSRRDTWSGKTIWWPVEGTSKIVPVDLAALPTYTRSREFDGFRGFGIVRMGDAAEDPHAAGLSFGAAQEDHIAEPVIIEQDNPPAGEPAVLEDMAVLPDGNGTAGTDDEVTGEISRTDAETIDENVGDEGAGDEPVDELAAETVSAAPVVDEDDQREEVSDDDAGLAEDENQQNAADWPEGEPPALTLADSPGRRHSDKVVQLEERRSRLSAGEQANFQEIARRLDRFVKWTDRSKAEADEVAGDEDTIVDAAASTAPEDDIRSRETEFDENEDLIPETDEVVEPSMSGDEEEPQTLDEEQPEELQASQEGDEPEAAHSVEASDDTVVSLFDEQAAETSDEVFEDEAEDETHEPVDAAALAAMLPGRDRTGLSEEIIDQMPVALLVHAGDTLIHANGEFLKLTGYSSLEALGDVGGLDALLQRQELEEKTTHAGGMVVVRADDVIVPVTARLQSIRFNDTSALMLALMPVAAEVEPPESTPAEVLPLRPIRSADQMAKLQVEVEELRAILETATDGVVIIGSDREVRSMNRAASALFNFDGEDINGKPFVTLFAHESQRAILDYLSGLSGHGVASVLNDGREVIGREASGGFLPLFMTIGRLTSSNGYCAVIRDITQWKRTEDELRTAKRAAETANAHKSEFLAHVSHEIRTPLNAIIGFADMMASERLGPVGHPRYIEYSNDIGRSGRHVLDIVNDLLDISKIEAGELDLDFIAVGLNETVSEAVSLVQPQANGQRVIIRTALSQSVPQVVADLRSIKQIVLNILSNAIRFTPSGGQIVVSTAYEANGSVVLRIRDTGIGMTRPELELAMKPFRQVAGASRKRGDGTGLGLPLTKAMVDANRANFAITSAPNEGTLVEITFPSQRVLAS